MFGERGREFNGEAQRLGGMVHTETCWKLDGYRHLFEEDERPRRIARDGIVASVQAFRYGRDTSKSDELHRRFRVGSIPELPQKTAA